MCLFFDVKVSVLFFLLFFINKIFLSVVNDTNMPHFIKWMLLVQL